MSDGSIIIDSRIDDKQFQKDIKNMEKSLAKTGKAMSDFGGKMTKGITLPLVGAGVAIGKFALDLGNYADSVLDAADATGLSTDAIQRYEHVAKIAGTSTTAMTDAAGKLNRQWSSMMKGGGASAEAIEELGLSLSELDKLTVDQRLESIVAELANIEDPAERARIGSDLFGRQWEQIAPIVGMGTDEINKLADAYDGVMTPEDLQRANEVRVAWVNFKEELMLVGRELLSVLIPIFEGIFLPLLTGLLIPAIQFLADTVKGVVEWFGQLNPTTQNTILMFIGLAAAAGPLLMIGGKLLIGISSITGALMAMNPWVLAIIAVVMVLTTVVTYLWQENEVFREKVIEIWEFIKEFFITTFEFLGILFTTTLDFLKMLWEMWGQTLLDVATLIFTAISTFLTTTFEVVKILFETTIDFLTTLWDVWGETLLNVATFIFEAIYAVIQVTFDIVKTIFEVTTEFLSLMWEAWGELLFETIKLAFELIKEIIDITLKLITEIIEITISIIEAIWDKFGKYIVAAWDIWWGTMKDVVSVVFGVISGIIESALGLIKGVFDVFTGLVTGDWSRMWEGMANIVKSSANVIITIVNAIIGAVEALINAVGRAVNAIPSFNIPSWVPGLGGKRFGLPNIPRVNLPKLPSFDVGTDRITRDGLAMVHRDEMVVPAKSTGPFTGKGVGGNIEQNITINSPTPLSPNEIKQKLQEQSRRMALEWR